MTKRIIHRRFLCICLVLCMLISCFPTGTARAAMTESENGDLRVAAESFTHWYYDPELPSNNWTTTLEGWAVTAHSDIFPLVVHPSRVPDVWVDSGRNDAGREALVEKYRYTGTYWTLKDGLLDVNSGSEDPNSDYNLYLDEDTATLHLRDAYLEATYCLFLNDNVSTIMPNAGTDAPLTIELEGDNSILASHDSSIFTKGITFDPIDRNVDITSDLILTGEGSLKMACGAVGNNPIAESYAIYLKNSDLIIDGVSLNVTVQTAGGKYKSRTAFKANNVTIKDGSTVNVNLKEGSGGAVFDAQSVTIEDGSSLTVTMTRDCQMFASSASTLSGDGSGGKLRLQEGGELTIIVESGSTDLTGVLAEDTDLSQVEFEVDGMLILPEGSDATKLNGHITGSGTVVIRETGGTSGGTMYIIDDNSKSLKKAKDGFIDGDIKVSTGGSPVTDGTDGYTWTKETYYINEDGELVGLVGEEENGNAGIDGESGGDTTGEDESGGDTGSGEGETGGTSSELETIDVWTLEILRPNVLGDIIIEQVLPEILPMIPYTGDTYDHNYILNGEWLENYRSSHQNEVEIHIIAKSSSNDQCNIIGDVEVKYSFSYYNMNDSYSESSSDSITTSHEYLKVLGNLTFDKGNEINVDNITYKYGKVKIAGTLNGASIQAWKAELLSTADLTLSEGISLTENGDNFQISSQMNLTRDEIDQLPIILGLFGDKSYWNPENISEYETLLETQFFAACENSFIVQDGAQYKTTGASSSPIQVNVTTMSAVARDGLDPEDCPQIIITLKGNNDPEDGDKNQDKDGEGEDEEKDEGEEGGEKEDSDNPTSDGNGTNEPGVTPETPGVDAGGENDGTSTYTINLNLTQDDVSSFIDFPDNSSLFPEGSEFIMKKSAAGNSSFYSTYTFSVKYPIIEDAEDEISDYSPSSPSSDSDLGSRLPSAGGSTDAGDAESGTEADGEGETAGETADGDGGYSQPANCVSDTLGPITVNGSYQFKLTSTDGSAPVVTVSGSAFRVLTVSQDGNDFYVKIYAVGAPGSTSDVYVNGVRVATATVGSVCGGVLSDTTAPFTVRQGETYQFRLTSDTMPSMTAGSSSFTVEYAGNSGRDWFFKVHAVGEIGDGCGFYVNGAPFPVAIAHITAKES